MLGRFLPAFSNGWKKVERVLRTRLNTPGLSAEASAKVEGRIPPTAKYVAKQLGLKTWRYVKF